MPKLARIFLLSCLATLAACGADIDTSCEPAGDVRPLCGVQMPEDIVALPNGGGLLIGEFGNMGQIPGALTWYQPGPQAEFIRLADSASLARGTEGVSWGDRDCTPPDQLSPHGIHLSQRGQALQLLVVNHSSREHVLFYEVQPAPSATYPPALVWRGCVEFPQEAVLNDVAALGDGGFAVTHMYSRENELLAQFKSYFGFNNGHVWRWSPGAGLSILPNSSARMPNGIEVSPDGASVWVNNYIQQELRQYDIDSGEILRTIEIPNIDNSSWMADGRLLVASHLSPLSMGSCFGVTEGSCGSGYELIVVDLASGTTQVAFRIEEGGPFGPATVAVPYKGKLYAGSFSGDRMAEITLR